MCQKYANYSRLKVNKMGVRYVSVQDWNLQCPSNVIWPFKIYHSQNNPSKCNPKLTMKTSLEVLNIIYPPTRTSRRRALSLATRSRVRCSILNFFTLHRKHVPYKSCTSLIRALCIIFIFLDRRLGFEPAFRNGTHMRASTLNIDMRPTQCSRLKSFKCNLAL